MEFKADEFVILLMRWIHLFSGVTWIGLLYYFNLVQVPFMKETDAVTKSGVVQKLVPRALWYFRYAALLTVLSGLIIVWSHFMHGHGHDILKTSWGVSIVIGGGLGIIMFLNVWLLIWPNQKVVIRMTTEAAANKTAPPPEMAKHARVAFLASRTNFYLSFPMLFFMATASHFQLF